MRLHSLQVLLPAHVLAVNVANVCYEECVFVARLTGLVIDIGDTLIHDITNHGFAVSDRKAMSGWTTQAFAALNNLIVCFSSIDGRWCHTLASEQEINRIGIMVFPESTKLVLGGLENSRYSDGSTEP